MIDISSKEVVVKCPKCKTPTRVTLNQIIEETTIKCSGCSSNIKLVDKGKSAQKAVRDINKSLSDFRRAFRSLGK